jgi:capsular exopolysaccharide synthesis family protein
LMIDSDLRMPSLARYLGIESDLGLSDVLDGTASLEETIIELHPSGLCVLPGGHARGDVAELISGSNFKEILSEARRMFDYVIIDAPPLAIFTDAAVLINHADGALLVVKANQTKYKDIDRVLNSLPRKRLLGTVLNQSEDSLMTDGYYGYSDYAKLLSE